jgi:hypothetical protein
MKSSPAPPVEGVAAAADDLVVLVAAVDQVLALSDGDCRRKGRR